MYQRPIQPADLGEAAATAVALAIVDQGTMMSIMPGSAPFPTTTGIFPPDELGNEPQY